jgi:hypothetical protein
VHIYKNRYFDVCFNEKVCLSVISRFQSEPWSLVAGEAHEAGAQGRKVCLTKFFSVVYSETPFDLNIGAECHYVPDPLLLRKSGSSGSRNRTSDSVARNSDH